jgi:hypothetical protein
MLGQKGKFSTAIKPILHIYCCMKSLRLGSKERWEDLKMFTKMLNPVPLLYFPTIKQPINQGLSLHTLGTVTMEPAQWALVSTYACHRKIYNTHTLTVHLYLYTHATVIYI